MAQNSDFQEVVQSLFKGMDGFVDAKTVVGEPVTVGDTIILPLVDVSFGVGAGAGTNDSKKSGNGGGALGAKLSPSAVLVIRDGITRLVSVKNQDTINKVIDMVPGVIDRFTAGRHNPMKDKDVQSAVKEAADASAKNTSGGEKK